MMNLVELQDKVVGLDEKVTLLDGSMRRYINFDNAASTPTLIPVQEKVNEFLIWYSNVHRGTGFKSQLSSRIFEESREIVGNFVKADDNSSVIFCKNTTEAINKLALRFLSFSDEEKPIILTTIMEHHSNELPWRKVGKVKHIGLNSDGTIDMDDFKKKLRKYGDRVKLVAVSGASNVTGYINKFYEMAKMTHNINAKILLDAAQIAPHRPIDVKPYDDPEHIDYLAFSAHKMYAPYGVGILIADKEMFKHGDPDYVGGGTVELVNLESVYWKDLPEREEAGTPDIVGVVALAKVIKLLKDVGFDSIIEHETELTSYALKRLNEIPEVVIYGNKNPDEAIEKLGVISFNIEGFHHALVAAILSYEGGIGVRNGCFCAQPYIWHLLGVNEKKGKEIENRILNRDRSIMPGTVRISFGLYNKKDEIDHLINMLNKIIKGDYSGKYLMNQELGEYLPEGFKFDFESFFKL